jgi:hypothetical protein
MKMRPFNSVPQIKRDTSNLKESDLKLFIKEQFSIEKKPRKSSHIARENAVFICPNVLLTGRGFLRSGTAKC